MIYQAHIYNKKINYSKLENLEQKKQLRKVIAFPGGTQKILISVKIKSNKIL